jgi:hypothetical protein
MGQRLDGIRESNLADQHFPWHFLLLIHRIRLEPHLSNSVVWALLTEKVQCLHAGDTALFEIPCWWCRGRVASHFGLG